MLFTAFLLCFSAILSTNSFAQEQSSKPNLAAIILDESTTSTQALDIAKNTIPDLFITDDDLSGEHSVFASYIQLDKKNKKRFLGVTIIDEGYFCTSYGCPFYILESLKNNQWKIVLSVQAHAILRDVRSQNNKPQNIISVETAQAIRKNSVWLWDGIKYKKVNE